MMWLFLPLLGFFGFMYTLGWVHRQDRAVMEPAIRLMSVGIVTMILAAVSVFAFMVAVSTYEAPFTLRVRGSSSYAETVHTWIDERGLRHELSLSLSHEGEDVTVTKPGTSAGGGIPSDTEFLQAVPFTLVALPAYFAWRVGYGKQVAAAVEEEEEEPVTVPVRTPVRRIIVVRPEVRVD